VGQTLGDAELTRMHQLKTGALIRVSATSPAHFVSAAPELLAKLNTFGDCVGLAFQIHDDVLDVTGTTEKIGKSAQKDARKDKPTFPGLLGLDASKKRANELLEKAVDTLTGFPGNCDALAWLAAYAVNRDS
jgi:geranylgeranyl pyrophosphate synthase